MSAAKIAVIVAAFWIVLCLALENVGLIQGGSRISAMVPERTVDDNGNLTNFLKNEEVLFEGERSDDESRVVPKSSTSGSVPSKPAGVSGRNKTARQSKTMHSNPTAEMNFTKRPLVTSTGDGNNSDALHTIGGSNNNDSQSAVRQENATMHAADPSARPSNTIRGANKDKKRAKSKAAVEPDGHNGAVKRDPSTTAVEATQKAPPSAQADNSVGPKEEDDAVATTRRRRPLKVDIYGGSVSLGAGANQTHRYSVLLDELVPDIQVRNLAIGGSGPEHWLLCDIEPADIIISEFRINEQDERILGEWYDLTRRRARHTVLLELWSWLNPPNKTADAMSWNVFQRQYGTYVAEDLAERQLQGNNTPLSRSTYSALRLDVIDQDNWRALVPELFAYHDDSVIAPSCFETILERDESEREEQARCRDKYPNGMQHGFFPYHERIAQILALHLSRDILPTYFNCSDELPPLRDENDGSQTTKPPRMCFGDYGWKEESPLKANWSSVVTQNTGFAINNPFSDRVDKLTLNSDVVNSTLRLACPDDHPFMYIGYIAHTEADESCWIQMNNRPVTNHLQVPYSGRYRIRQYYPVERSPVEIRLTHVTPNASFELSDVVCGMTNDYAMRAQNYNAA